MQLLVSLKFGWNRPAPLSTILINLQEVTFLGLLIAQTFAPFYLRLFEVFVFTELMSNYVSIITLTFNLLMIILALLALVPALSALAILWPSFSIFLKVFPYLGFIPLFSGSIDEAFESDSLMDSILAGFNSFIFIGYLILYQFLNESLKFREADFCNRRLTSFMECLLLAVGITILRMWGPTYATLIYLLRCVMIISRMYGHFEYKLVQKFRLFYAVFGAYVSIVTFMHSLEFISKEVLAPLANSFFIFTSGAIVCWFFSQQLRVHIIYRLNSHVQWSNERNDSDNIIDKQEDLLPSIENEIKCLVQVVLERELYMEQKSNEYKLYWNIFSQRVFLHRIKCDDPYCFCHRRGSKKKKDEEIEWQVYITDLMRKVQDQVLEHNNEPRLKLVNIYLLIDVALKPLKGYFQLISIKKKKTSVAHDLEIKDLVARARQCFDQIFSRNKVQNQQLQLLRVIRTEQAQSNLQEDLRSGITQTITFLETFTYSSVKMSHIEVESAKLFDVKKDIGYKLEKLVWQNGDSPIVNLYVYMFYRMLEMYRSREIEFKKLGIQQAMKKRILLKTESEVVSSDAGIIYIDLVEDRGRIRKITHNISDFFGYPKEDMINSNINQFMPSLFGKFHAKFLSNFIDKGRIKLLKQKKRVVFGKNKKKYIFPVNVRLKTEHLLDQQFGASAVLTAVDSSSEYMVVGKNGRIEQMTEGLYTRTFSKTLHDEVGKLTRLCGYKCILGLHQILELWEDRMANKIYQGLFIFSQNSDYLFEKFRYTRDNNVSATQSKSKSMSVESQASSLGSFSDGSITDLRSERYEFFAELFKVFMIDIDPTMLKAFKITYKYSRVKTAEFECELIELLTIRDEISPKDFYRELISQLNNVAQIYQLLEEHAPLSRHLMSLEDNIDKMAPARRSSIIDGPRMSLQKIDMRQLQVEDEVMPFTPREDDSGSELLEDQKNQRKTYQTNSEQSSILGHTEAESKKQMIVNALNSSEGILQPQVILAVVIVIIVLLTLLGLNSYFSFIFIEHLSEIQKDTNFQLQVSTTIEYELAFREIERLSQLRNFTIEASLYDEVAKMSQHATEVVQKMNKWTDGAEVPPDDFSQTVQLFNPNRGINFTVTYPNLVTQLVSIYRNPNSENIELLRHNYQVLHTWKKDFYDLRSDHLLHQNQDEMAVVNYIFAIFEAFLGLIAICSIPLYVCFKWKENEVRSKLGYMNTKQIKKAIARLRMTHDFLKEQSNKKNSLNHFQSELVEKREKEQAVTHSRNIKISAEAVESKILTDPFLYLAILLFIGFFSNLALSSYIISINANHFFNQVVQSNRLLNDFEVKTPLMINMYLSNVNRALLNQSHVAFAPKMYDQSQSGYFELEDKLASQGYIQNLVSSKIYQMTTEPICQQITCPQGQDRNMSLTYLVRSFKDRFNYWNPDNSVTINTTTIDTWLQNNYISVIVGDLEKVMKLWQLLAVEVDRQFESNINKTQLILIILTALLLPINILCLLLVTWWYFKLLNRTVKNAEEIFMHFPVNVLLENTYLTNYFNSKTKHSK